MDCRAGGAFSVLSSHLNSLFTCVFIFGALSGRFSVRGVWHVYTWSWCVVWEGVARGAAEACRRPRGFCLPGFSLFWVACLLGSHPFGRWRCGYCCLLHGLPAALGLGVLLSFFLGPHLFHSQIPGRALAHARSCTLAL